MCFQGGKCVFRVGNKCVFRVVNEKNDTINDCLMTVSTFSYIKIIRVEGEANERFNGILITECSVGWTSGHSYTSPQKI